MKHDDQLIWESYVTMDYNKDITIYESVTNELVVLQKYINMSDKDKFDDIAFVIPYYIDEFINDYLYDENVEFINTKEYNQLEDYEKIDWLNSNGYQNIILKYGEHLIFNINKYMIDPSEIPSWFYFLDGDAKIVKNEWLVHFTDYDDEILRDGFTKGVEDIGRLGLTNYLSDIDKKYGGYNFAYSVDDFNKYGKSRWNGGRGWKYGKGIILFQGSGVKTWHNSDNEPQVIFYGKFAKNIIQIVQDYNVEDYMIISVINGNILYRNKDLYNVVNWCIRNFRQYNKHLVSRVKLK